MSIFKELDQEEIRKVIQGHEDVLAPLLRKEESFLRNSICPICNSSSHETFVNSSNPYTSGSPLPNKILRCLQCKTEFDPYSQLVTRVNVESD